MAEKLPPTIHDLPTPCLLVDIDKVKKNCQRMIDICTRMGVELRPHMKTHKTAEAGVLATGGTKRKIAVSTLQEAEFYADNGFDDILWAKPMSKIDIPRCKKIANNLNAFHVMFENAEALCWLQDAKLESGKKWSAVLEVDTGYGRTGVCWDHEDIVTLSKAAQEADNISFLGVYTHCGASYYCHSEEELEAFGVENTKRILYIKERLEAAGVKCPTVGTGSTPSCSKPSTSMSALTEFHPGNYIFYDVQGIEIGACTIDDVAVKVATRVIAHKPSTNHIAVDAGFLAISQDGLQSKGNQFCLVQDHPDLRIIDMSQEISKMSVDDGNLDFNKYPLGHMLFLYPNHSCATACMHRVFYIHSGDKVVAAWIPTSGW